MKKLTVFTLVLALLLSLSSVALAADDNTQTQTPKQVTVTFELGETAVRTGNYAVKYPKDYLQYVSATPSGADNVTTEGNVSQVEEAFVYANTTSVSLTFNVLKDDKNVDVTFVPEGFVSVDGEPVTVSEMTKTVTIKAEEQQPGEVTPTNPDNTQTPGGTVTPENPGTQTPAGTDTPAANTNNQSQASNSAKPAEFDQTGLNVAVVAVIALVVIAGAIVLIKRK